MHANTSNLVLVRRPFCVEFNRFQFEFHPGFILFYTEPTQTRIKYAWLFFIMGYRTPNVTILKSCLGNEIGRTVPGYSFISCTWHNSLCYACRSAENQRTQHIDLSTTRPTCPTKNHINLQYRLISHYCSPDCAGCKKRVKCTLAQALRLCTGRTAHRGSRGIALPFN